MAMPRFTDTRIKALPRPKHPTVVTEDGDRGAGRLGLRLTPGGARSWVFVWWADGLRRSKTLGSYPSMSITDAREAARALSATYQQGGAEAMVEAKAPEVRFGTLAEALDAYYADMRRRGKRTADDVKRQLDIYLRGYEGLLATEAREVTAEQLVEVVRAAHLRGAVVANRVLATLKAALKVAMAADLDPTAPSQGQLRWGLTANVAAGIPHNGLAVHARERWLRPDEFKAVFEWLESDDAMPEVPRRLVLICMLSGQRLGEVGKLKVANVDVAGLVWRIAPEQHKSGKGNALPMTARMVPHFERLFELAGDSEWLTPARCAGRRLDQPIRSDTVSKALVAAVKRLNAVRKATGLELIEPIQGRDLRRTWASLASDVPGVDLVALNVVQGHALPGVSQTAQRHYLKGDGLMVKRRVLDAFDAFVSELLAGEQDPLDVAIQELAAAQE